MTDIDIFRDEFIPNIETFNKLNYSQWKSSNPGEATAWETYRDALLAGQSSIPPTLATKFGKALVASGKLVSVTESPSFTVSTNITEDQILTGPVAWVGIPSHPASQVRFYIDGTLVWTENVEPYQFNGDPNGQLSLSAGTHVLKVEATASSDGTIASVTRNVTMQDMPGPGTLLLHHKSDMTYSDASITEIATPSGPGFKVVCSEANPASWDSTYKAVFNGKYYIPENEAIGKTERWEFDLFLPTQQLIQDWNVGVLWEFHTKRVPAGANGPFPSSGHNIALYSNGTFRIVEQTGPGQTYQFHQGPSVQWNVWTPVKWEIKWSYGSDGFVRLWIGSQQVLNHQGASLFDQEFPYLQFGWYSKRQLTNEVHFGNVRMTRL